MLQVLFPLSLLLPPLEFDVFSGVRLIVVWSIRISLSFASFPRPFLRLRFVVFRCRVVLWGSSALCLIVVLSIIVLPLFTSFFRGCMRFPFILFGWWVCVLAYASWLPIVGVGCVFEPFVFSVLGLQDTLSLWLFFVLLLYDYLDCKDLFLFIAWYFFEF